MPIPSKTRYPLESFDPRLRAIWLTAVREPVEISFDSSRLAIAFQNRLQQFRAAVKREDPDAARLLYRAKCSRSGNLLRLAPADSEFASILDALEPQLLARTVRGSDYTPELPPASNGGAAQRSSATPLPPRDGINDSPIALEDLFADIPISYIPEDDTP